jgi:hypothetical protein
MPQPGLFFRPAAPAGAAVSARADVAVFVGLVARRPGTVLPDGILRTLQTAGWANSAMSRPRTARPDAQVAALLDVPVPIDGWDIFDALFAWDSRPVEAGGTATTPSALGAAVRTFFAEGGRRCYVIRCGDPPPLLPDAADARTRRRLLLDWKDVVPPTAVAARRPLLPGLLGLGVPASPADPATWHGVAHALGLDDAALVCLPDLPDLLATDPAPVPPPPPPPPVPEQFVPCVPHVSVPGPPGTTARPTVTAPRLDAAGYRDWASALRFTLSLLGAPSAAGRRDLMLVAAFPLPAAGQDAPAPDVQRWPLALLAAADGPMAGATYLDPDRLGSARLQLAYPWVVSALSAVLPEGVQSPDGVLVGAIARTALLNGVHTSAAGTRLASVQDTLPELASGDVLRGVPNGADWLGDRITLIGRDSQGFLLLSDATCADDIAWRAGNVSRLIATILRGARRLGQDLLFESSVEALWTRVTRDLSGYLTTLWDLGALDGATPGEAFEVHCDRSTMTQADIDAGRLIVRVAVTVAQPVERITVTLTLAGDAGTISEAA